MSLVNVQCSNSTKTLVSSAKMIVFIGADTTKWLIKIVPASSWVRHQLVTYLSSHFHLVDIIYQSSSIHFMHQLISPTHSFGHWFPSHSFYRSQSVLFTFSIFGFAHTASYFNLIVSFIFFNQSRLWKLGELGVSLDKILIRNIYCIIWSWNSIILLLLVT